MSIEIKLREVALCLFALCSLCWYRAASQVPSIRVNGRLADELVDSGSRVELGCYNSLTGSSEAATYFLNGQEMLSLREDTSNSVSVIESMSVEYQGRYSCQSKQSKQHSSNELAVIIPPPKKSPPPVIAAVGENISLICPLQVAPGLERFYTVEWRHPNDIRIVQSGEIPQVPWASFNNDTLVLTVGPYNSSLPSMFECVSISFQRQNMNPLHISQSTKGSVQVIIPQPQLPCMTTMPMVVVSNDTFNVSCICGTNDVQTLHNPEYQFFFNGKPINVSTLNSSYTMVQASKTGNFTCRAIQYTDKRTPIPTQLSPPVQAIVLEAPILKRTVFAPTSTDGCSQLVIGSLSQPQPVKMSLQYFFHSTTAQPASCTNQPFNEPILYASVAAGLRDLNFEVNLTDSRFDTRNTVYLTSRFVMDNVAGPCSRPVRLRTTEMPCPPQPPLTVGQIIGIAVGGVAVVLVAILVTILVILGVIKIKKQQEITIVKRNLKVTQNEKGVPGDDKEPVAGDDNSK